MEEVQYSLSHTFQLPVEIKTPKESKEAFKFVSECRYFIAMRFHSYIFAVTAQVPCTLLSYSKKTDEITEYSLAEYLAKQKRTHFFWQEALNI